MKSSQLLPILSASALLAGSAAVQAGEEIALGTMNRVNVVLTCERPPSEPVVNMNTRTEMTRLRLDRFRLGNREILESMSGNEIPGPIRGWGLVEFFDSDANTLGIFAHNRKLGTVPVPMELLSYSGPEEVVEAYSTTVNLDSGDTTQDDRRWTGITSWTIDGWEVSGPTMGRKLLRYQRTTPPSMWYVASYQATVYGLNAGETNVYCSGRVQSNGGGPQINVADYVTPDL